MPLVPQYIQQVSEKTVPGYGYKHKMFTNMSSQQMNPGALPTFFRGNNPFKPMPFAQKDLNVPNQPIVQQINEKNNVSNLPKKETLTESFEQEVGTKNRRFRTASMRAWDVPLSMTETRATDAMF